MRKQLSMNNNDLVSKLWKMCDTLRDGGVSYQNYVNELASLLFLKMCKETGLEESYLPEGMRWDDLIGRLGQDQHQFYRNMLVQLGADEHAVVRAIFLNVNTTITQPSQLSELITEMDNLDWYNHDPKAKDDHKTRDDFGDMYEGLLQKNANETKSGAGQYFTPRPLIDLMVRLLNPQAGEVIQDPASGTGGFLIAADRHIKQATDNMETLSGDEQEFQMTKAFVGVELVPETRRLALMNCLLHDIEGDIEGQGGAIRLGNSLGGDGEHLPSANVILSNPPFGSAAGTNITRKFVHDTNNKQLCFMQHIYNGLEPGGRAAVVIPDNVLFEAGVGTRIRQDLMNKCNLHTILRLPTGIFYAAGVKTNVLFFQKGTPENPNQDVDCTKNTWVYDLRTNLQTFGKRSPFTGQYLESFATAYGVDANGQSPREEGIFNCHGSKVDDSENPVLDNARWRCFSRDYIRDTKSDSLDISWLKDSDSIDAADLPEPDVLAAQAMTELTEALRELDSLMTALGASDQANVQKDLLANVLGLADEGVK